MVNASELFEKYRTRLDGIIGQIKDKREAAVPAILAEITTQIIPAMMSDVGKIKSLSGTEKKQLIIDSVDLSITEIFKELNKIPELAAATWDETLRDLLLTLIGPLINLLISVENNEIKFNKKVSGCFTCCRS